MNFCRISPFHRTHRTVCRDPAPATGWGAARAVPGARLRRARRDLSFGPRRPARTRGDGLAFASGVYLYTACCVVASEFYASGMAKMAEREGHAVDRAWVALRLAHFVAASALSLLVALMLRGIAERYRYYGLLPRLQ